MMPVSNSFELEPFTRADKSLTIIGPDDLTLWVDFDDVEHDEVENAVRRLVNLLNAAWRG